MDKNNCLQIYVLPNRNIIWFAFFPQEICQGLHKINKNILCLLRKNHFFKSVLFCISITSIWKKVFRNCLHINGEKTVFSALNMWNRNWNSLITMPIYCAYFGQVVPFPFSKCGMWDTFFCKSCSFYNFNLWSKPWILSSKLWINCPLS